MSDVEAVNERILDFVAGRVGINSHGYERKFDLFKTTHWNDSKIPNFKPIAQ